MAVTRQFYLYTSDNKTLYAILLYPETATQGGFDPTQASKILDGTYPVWCWHPKSMRHVTGVSTSGKKARLPIAKNDNAKYVNGGQFTLGAVTYNIRGCEGENRRGNQVVA